MPKWLPRRIATRRCIGAERRGAAIETPVHRAPSTRMHVVSLWRSFIGLINVFLHASLRIRPRAFCLPTSLQILNVVCYDFYLFYSPPTIRQSKMTGYVRLDSMKVTCIWKTDRLRLDLSDNVPFYEPHSPSFLVKPFSNYHWTALGGIINSRVAFMAYSVNIGVDFVLRCFSFLNLSIFF